MRRRDVNRVPGAGALLGAALALLLGAWMPVAASAAAAPTKTADEDPILARTYRVRYLPLADTAELVEPVLSDDGELSMQVKQGTLVVVDRVSVLDRVGSLLESYDLPPRNVQLTLTLILGTDDSEAEAGRMSMPNVSKSVVDVVEKLQGILKWKQLELIGSHSVNGIEGGKVSANLSDEYRVVFRIDQVDEVAGKVLLQDFAVQKIVPLADGGVRYDDVYAMDVVSPIGRLNVLGAASGPEANRALFLTLQAEVR
jgi:hypothetical protein